MTSPSLSFPSQVDPSFSSYASFLRSNVLFLVHAISEAVLLAVLALAVSVSGRRLRHRVKFSDVSRVLTYLEATLMLRGRRPRRV